MTKLWEMVAEMCSSQLKRESHIFFTDDKPLGPIYYWWDRAKEEGTMRTVKEMKRLHIELFDLIKEKGYNKLEALRCMGIPEDLHPPYRCFACEAAGVTEEEGPEPYTCAKCPVDWGIRGKTVSQCADYDSPYGRIKNLFQSKGERLSPLVPDERTLLKEAAAKILALPFINAWKSEVFENIKVGEAVYNKDGRPFVVTAVMSNNFNAGGIGQVYFDGSLVGINILGPVLFPLPPPLNTGDQVGEEKRKAKVMVHRKEVIEGVKWSKREYYIPSAYGAEFNRFINKPPMTMTLEWDEEVME